MAKLTISQKTILETAFELNCKHSNLHSMANNRPIMKDFSEFSLAGYRKDFLDIPQLTTEYF